MNRLARRDDAGARLGDALRSGCQIADHAFDALLPPRYRSLSGDHWTPVGTALQAARWLCPDARARVLDVGAGVGKACVIGSLATSATFVGVEQRPHLVEVARQRAASVGASSATFLCADAFSLDWSEFDGLYFFNPFSEADLPVQLRQDSTVAYPEDDHAQTMAKLIGKLASLKPGARVSVFHALGCPLPEEFRRAEHAEHGDSALELWVKR